MKHSTIKFNKTTYNIEQSYGYNDEKLNEIIFQLNQVEPNVLYNMLRVLEDDGKLKLDREEEDFMIYKVL